MAFLLIVCGPSGSGKSALGVALAEALEGEVLNMDSVQVYRGLEIGSAKLSLAERRGIPHHLLDICDPTEHFSVGAYLERAEATISSLEARGRLPIFVGGTTLYLTALLHGLATLPSRDADLRAALATKSDEALHAQLATLDPESAQRLHPHDRLRVARAIEASLLAGRPLSAVHAEHRREEGRHRALILTLAWPRDSLYARINTRTQRMLTDGLVQETSALLEKFGEGAPALSSIGYAETLDVLRGVLPREELESSIAQATRRYAKRQLTYLRNEPRKRGWVVTPSPLERLQPRRHGEQISSPSRTLTRAVLVQELLAFRGLSHPAHHLWCLDGSALVS